MNATPGRPRVHVRADDPSLTPFAGLLHVGELAATTRLIDRIDEALPSLKRRDRGLSPGEFLVSAAENVLSGGECLWDLDVLRGDHAGAALRAVADPPAPTTAGQYFRRFRLPDLWKVEGAVAEAGADLDRRCGLAPDQVTLDADSTWCEVFGPAKEGTGWTHDGERAYQPFVVFWAERGRPLAADLLAGNDNAVRPAPRLLRRALKAVPEGAREVRLRADAGFYSAPLMALCQRTGVRFSISAKRTTAVWREIGALADQAFRPAIGMAGAEVAEGTHHVEGVGQVRLIVRRVEVSVAELPTVRGRRRRTIPKEQLQLALDGKAATVYAYSAIVTDLEGDVAEIEHFHRERAGMEELFKAAKLGVGMRHMPMGRRRANAAWMVACLLALTLASMLCQVAGMNQRAQGKRLRRELIRIPGRMVRSGRRVILRLPEGFPLAGFFLGLYDTLRALGPPG